MNYEFDVFVSYSRAKEWPMWVRNHFLPLFDHWLSTELGHDASIFVDTDMESGLSWPQELGRALARSRVLVPLWSRNYFASIWCTTEFSQMRAREDHCQYRTPQRPTGLIVPAIIHDGDEFPWDVGQINHVDLCQCANVRMVRDGSTAEELSRRLRDWVPSVRSAIESAPPYDAEWDELSASDFIELYRRDAPVQISVPRLL